MGLDMFLSAKFSLSECQKEEKEQMTIINNLFGLRNTNFNYTVTQVEFDVAYWRNAQLINLLFINQIRDEINYAEYKEYRIYRDQLECILNICKDFIDDYPIYSEKDITYPTRGYIFNDDKIYDECSYNNIKDTIEMLEQILKQEIFKKAEFYYHWSY